MLAQGDPRLLQNRQSPDPILSQEAKRDYAQRLQEIDTELDAARKQNDEAEIRRLQGERDTLLGELRKATQPTGRDRRLGPPSEPRRAADSVRMSLRRQYGRLNESGLSELADHLKRSIRPEANAFAYQPDEPAPDWHL